MSIVIESHNKNGSSNEPPAKRQRRGTAEGHSLELVEGELQVVQFQLEVLDNQCAEEQIAIQQKWDLVRRSHFEKRSEIVQQVPGFWCAVFCGHPLLQFHLRHPLELKALDFLSGIDLQDIPGSDCSYQVCLSFCEKNMFEEKTATKKVISCQDSVKVYPATLTPKDERGHEVLAEATSTTLSLLGWLLSSQAGHPDGSEDFGTLFRRELWQNPMPYYLASADQERCTEIVTGVN